MDDLGFLAVLAVLAVPLVLPSEPLREIAEPMYRALRTREIPAIAMGAPFEMWISLGGLLFTAAIGFVESPPAEARLLGGTGLPEASVVAAGGVGLAMVGEFRGLLLAVGAFAIRAILYRIYAFDPVGKLAADPHGADPEWLWSACLLPALLLMPNGSPRVVRYLRNMWALRPAERRG